MFIQNFKTFSARDFIKMETPSRTFFMDFAKSPTQAFSCEFCIISKNSCFTGHLQNFFLKIPKIYLSIFSMFLTSLEMTIILILSCHTSIETAVFSLGYSQRKKHHQMKFQRFSQSINMGIWVDT